ncbi:MAG: 6-pyruvoyl-tetrahydropterin synthase-related protein [Pyrinomonadaceae bacterium]
MLLLAAIVLTAPIYYFGMPAGNDLPQHFRFVQTFYEAVHSGTVYPAWPGSTNLGFGDVGIRFYPPLAYYSVVLFRTFAQSWTTAFAVTICFWFFIGGVGMYLLARDSFSEKASTGAALIFMAMPYHANQVYNAGLFAEFVGLAILPFCFLFLRRTISTGGWTDMAALSIAYALLILAHLPLAIIGSLGLLIYALAAIEKKSLTPTLLKLGAAVLTALAATAFYWVRMVSELAYVNHSGAEFTGQSYDFHRNFLGSIFYLPAADYAETSLWFTDLLFAITLAMIVPTVIGFFLSRKNIPRSRIVPFLAVCTFAIVVATPLSLWIWESFEPLRKIQFPWRFLGLISLAGSFLIAAGLDELPSIFKTKLRPVGLIASGLIIAGVVFTGTQVMRPANYSSRVEFDEQFDKYRSDDSYECWWPVWARRDAFSNRERAYSATRSVAIVEWRDEDRSFVVDEGGNSTLRIATFYYPFWKAIVNGENASVTPAEDGTLTIAVPSQRSDVRLFFAQPLYETVAGYLSLTIWLLLGIGLIIGRATKLKRPDLS